MKEIPPPLSVSRYVAVVYSTEGTLANVHVLLIVVSLTLYSVGVVIN